MEEFINRKNQISASLICLMTNIESIYDLRKGEFYQVKTSEGKVHDVFYEKCFVHTCVWSSGIDIVLSFFKSKKDGTKSKIKKSFFIKEVSAIDWFPF